MTGAQALARGLVDELGDLEAAVRAARALVGIPPDADVPVVPIDPLRSAGVPARIDGTSWEALAAAGRLLAQPALLLTNIPAL